MQKLDTTPVLQSENKYNPLRHETKKKRIHTSNNDPKPMNSITIHILGGFVQAAMKRTTLG